MSTSSFIHGVTVMGERGQIVIPQNIRAELALTPGQEMTLIAREGVVVVLPAEKLHVLFEDFLRGVLPQKKKRLKPKNLASSKVKKKKKRTISGRK